MQTSRESQIIIMFYVPMEMSSPFLVYLRACVVSHDTSLLSAVFSILSQLINVLQNPQSEFWKMKSDELSTFYSSAKFLISDHFTEL